MSKKFISWNVNGLRACIKKGFMDFFIHEDADFFCIQESKMHKGQADVITEKHKQYWNSADKPGYSGTIIFAKEEPSAVFYGIDGKYNDEGRLITLEYPDFYICTSYSPNARQELVRLDYRMEYEEDMRVYLSSLSRSKGVILCGDLNVAHNEIDLKNPKTNIGNPGFSYEERSCMSALLNSGFVDSFRYLYPDKSGAYSWWSYRANARSDNTGWRIDYFIVSESLKDKIKDSVIYNEVYGSDHCPVGLLMDL